MDPTLILIILVSSLSLGLIGTFFMVLYLKKEIFHLKKFNTKLFSRLSGLMQDVQSLGNVTVDIGEQVNHISRQIHHLDSRQDEIDLRDQTEKPIQQAIALVERGADIEEIIQNCHLSHAEAELLLRIHSE